MPEFGRRAKWERERQIAPRAPAVTLKNKTAGATPTTAGEIVDFSSEEASVTLRTHTHVGDAVLIKAGAMVVLADVIWVKAPLCQVRFEVPLRSSELEIFASGARSALVRKLAFEEMEAEGWRSTFAR